MYCPLDINLVMLRTGILDYRLLSYEKVVNWNREQGNLHQLDLGWNENYVSLQ